MRFEPRRAFSVSRTLARSGRDALPRDVGFLRDSITDRDALTRAAQQASRQGAAASSTLMAVGAVSETLYYLALARHLGLPYEEGWPLLEDTASPSTILAAGRAKCAAPWRPWLIAPEGAALDLLLRAREARVAMPNTAITSPSRLRAIVALRCAVAVTYHACEVLPDIAPALSAKRASVGLARLGLLVGLATAIAGLFAEARGVADVFGVVFFSSMVFRLIVCAAGLGPPRKCSPALADRDLPSYSILVPLRHETDVVAELIEALERLDYPRAKLEALLLVEPEDTATRGALAALRLPPWCHIILCPDDKGTLRTKPRALNVGLQFARGALITVYDAEDRPEPQQLRLAAARFQDAAASLACLQARLAIGNGARSPWARLFAIEYAALFDVFNIGLTRLHLPLPLGGTSNHFRAAALRAVCGWDAWNVTEDADLGLRLGRLGYEIDSLDSTTFEEAPETTGGWFRQRRRWTKGWMQTLLVLAFDARAAGRQFGLGTSLLVCLLLTNLVVGPLLLPLFSAWVGYHLMRAGLPAPRSIWTATEATFAVSVIGLGMGSTLWTGWVGGRLRRLRGLVVGVPLLLPYQLAISAAAWGGLFDLVHAPFHWHKTAHGRGARRKP